MSATLIADPPEAEPLLQVPPPPSGAHLPREAFPQPAPRPTTVGGLLARRLLEAIPGFMLWALLLLPIVLAWAGFAREVAIAVLLFDIYWLTRSVAVIRRVFQSFKQLNADQAVDWLERCRTLEPGPGEPSWEDIIHVALIPTYTESYSVLRRTLDAWTATNWPGERKMVAIITRTTDFGGIANVRRLQEEFEGPLLRVIHILDPVLPGVVPGKSAAMAYGGPCLRAEVAEMGLDPAKVLVTDLDSDFRVHREYLAYVAHRYVQDPGRDHRAYQPLPMFHNNQWSVPFAVRVLASACTQWHMFLQQKLDRICLFSSYTASMKLVEDVGYWDCDIIPEDSRFYYKCFFRYGADFAVVPCFLPVYGDAPQTDGYLRTLKSQYHQIQRWAWGVTDIPYVFTNMWNHHEIPRWLRFKRTFSLLRTHLFWVFMPVFLFLGGAIPVWASTDFALTEFGRNLGFYSGLILTATLINASVLIWLDYRVSPPFPREWGFFRRAWALVQLLLYPFVGLALSVLPALDAQTRLLLGRYLEYRVTEKGA